MPTQLESHHSRSYRPLQQHVCMFTHCDEGQVQVISTDASDPAISSFNVMYVCIHVTSDIIIAKMLNRNIVCRIGMSVLISVVVPYGKPKPRLQHMN